jgi:hypothetical protein
MFCKHSHFQIYELFKDAHFDLVPEGQIFFCAHSIMQDLDFDTKNEKDDQT